MKNYSPNTLKEVVQELDKIDKNMAKYVDKFSQHCYENGCGEYMDGAIEYQGSAGPLDFFYWDRSYCFSFEDFEKRNKQLNKIFKKKKKAELNQLTTKIDYTGCDPEIAKFLKKNGGKRGILCNDGYGNEDFVVAYCKDGAFPYLAQKDSFPQAAICISSKKVKPKVKHPVDIMQALVDDGYEPDDEGNWIHDKKTWFVKGMWRYAGTDDTANYNWEPEWLVDE